MGGDKCQWMLTFNRPAHQLRCGYSMPSRRQTIAIAKCRVASTMLRID